MSLSNTVSRSRRYVAVCNKTNFDGNYFKSFRLPKIDPRNGQELQNDSETASWYFLNRLNFTACIDGCIAAEDFRDVTPERQHRDGSGKSFELKRRAPRRKPANVTITTERRSADYIAFLNGDRRLWGAGKTEAEAIGSALLSHAGLQRKGSRKYREAARPKLEAVRIRGHR